jgi:hypothetical protein
MQFYIKRDFLHDDNDFRGSKPGVSSWAKKVDSKRARRQYQRITEQALNDYYVQTLEEQYIELMENSDQDYSDFLWEGWERYDLEDDYYLEDHYDSLYSPEEDYDFQDSWLGEDWGLDNFDQIEYERDTLHRRLQFVVLGLESLRDNMRGDTKFCPMMIFENY